ncbi:ATPase WRNIP1 isoform X2 [Rhinatrema bivittatum]|uniref:ATPase WRNIP1 isoform X2 n=1 Tax=Rhinatrema bivittatum TaxID=194408 RepID=UPI00112E3A18|nr:ATPase WRNIP1 isoform X2 [Rhinatrema bivittatum]
MADPAAPELVRCPVCLRELEAARINAHLDGCLKQAEPLPRGDSLAAAAPPPSPSPRALQGGKRMRLSGPEEGMAAPSGDPVSAAPFPLFSKPRAGAESPMRAGGWAEPEGTKGLAAGAPSSLQKSLDGKPLADKMRPCALEDYVGQDKVLGEKTLLRTLLHSQEIPSIILWGPPGCGKTTLAHIIAKTSKKNGTRFVTLSATSASTNDVREVIKQAQNELRLFKRKTILFVDEIHRFNKLQQDTFLPHVECGTVTLIGATTENPSFEVNSALLSRCRVIVLEKLSVEALESILTRAVKSLGIRVLKQDARSEGANGGSNSEPTVYIEEKAISTLAHLCDGDARTGLNGLQLAVQARLATERVTEDTKDASENEILIQEQDVKEGLQRSHILYDRAGLADPLALNQAVAAYQGCHFIGMPECEVLLAQCVTYMARAPKSIEVYRAYSKVKECLKNHKGPLPPVPLHLRNAPTKLMKGLGYGRGYKYNPMYSKPVQQDYLPEELKGIKFF